MSKQFPPINLPDSMVDLTHPVKNKYDIKMKPSYKPTPTDNKQPINPATNPTAYPQPRLIIGKPDISTMDINKLKQTKLWSQQRRTFLK